MAIGTWEITQRLPAKQVAGQGSFFDDRDRLRLHAFAVDLIAADKALALKVFHRWVVDNGEEVRQHARLIAGSERADSPIRLAGLRLAAQDVRSDQRSNDVVSGV